DGLKSALSDFGLIRCVGGQEFAAQKDCVCDHGTKVIVDSGTEKTGVTERIFRGALLEIGNNFGFRQGTRELERPAQAKTFRYALKKFFDGFCTDGGEHFLPLGGALREIAHQAEASLPFAAI